MYAGLFCYIGKIIVLFVMLSSLSLFYNGLSWLFSFVKKSFSLEDLNKLFIKLPEFDYRTFKSFLLRRVGTFPSLFFEVKPSENSVYFVSLTGKIYPILGFSSLLLFIAPSYKSWTLTKDLFKSTTADFETFISFSKDEDLITGESASCFGDSRDSIIAVIATFSLLFRESDPWSINGLYVDSYSSRGSEISIAWS